MHHLDLLRSAPQAPPRPAGLSPELAVGVLAVLLAASAVTAWTSHREGAQLRQRLAAAEAAAGAVEASAAPRLDATVIAALQREVRGREALVTALTGERPDTGLDGGGGTAPSRWLAALADTGGPGVSIDTVRLEPGARLTLGGSALQPADVNAFIDRLQGHPVTGRVAIGTLAITAAEKPGEPPLRFTVTPVAAAEAPR